MSDNMLSELRASIDAIDASIISLIGERTAIARAIGQLKAEEGKPITDPTREAAIVANAAKLAREAGLPEEEIRTLYWQLVSLSRHAQLEDLPSH